MIKSLEFTATLPPNEIRRRLLKSIASCKSVKGAIAYWTINTNFFQNKLATALSYPDSFFCVDIQKPTNIDQLATFVERDSNIYLHHYKLDTYIKNEVKNENLLHQKTLLLDNGIDAEMWVGSYNMTKRALLGINKEAALIIKLTKDEAIYNEVNNYLELLQSRCIKFDLKDIKYYKWLQGIHDKQVLILKLLIKDLSQLRQPNATIQILGINKVRFSLINTVNTQLYLEVNDGTKTTHFLAVVLLAGEIDPSNPASYDINFHPMMHAVMRKGVAPAIMPVNEYNITSNQIKNVKYIVNIQVLKEVPLINYMRVPKDLWEDEYQEIERFYDDNTNQLSFMERTEKIKIKRASIEKLTKQTSFSLPQVQKEISKENLKKLFDYYDDIVTKNVMKGQHLENEKTDNEPQIIKSIPSEFINKSDNVIFKAIIKK